MSSKLHKNGADYFYYLYFLGGLYSVLTTPLLMSPIFYFELQYVWSRIQRLPWQAGANNLATRAISQNLIIYTQCSAALTKPSSKSQLLNTSTLCTTQRLYCTLQSSLVLTVKCLCIAYQ